MSWARSPDLNAAWTLSFPAWHIKLVWISRITRIHTSDVFLVCEGNSRVKREKNEEAKCYSYWWRRSARCADLFSLAGSLGSLPRHLFHQSYQVSRSSSFTRRITLRSNNVLDDDRLQLLKFSRKKRFGLSGVWTPALGENDDLLANDSRLI